MGRDDILRKVADADPLDRSLVEEWERGGAAEAVLARVLASAREGAPAVPPSRTTRHQWAWVAAVTALAVAAVLVAVLLTGGSGAPIKTPLLADRGRTLASLAVWAETHGLPGVQTPRGSVDAARSVQEAAAAEAMRGSGAAAFVNDTAATWGEVVAWLWMAVDGRAPRVPPLGFAWGAWRAPEVGMLVALIQAGVLPPGTALVHNPQEPVTEELWEGLLLRLGD